MKGPRIKLDRGNINFSCHGCEYLGGYAYDAVRPCLKIGKQNGFNTTILDYQTPENCPYVEKLIKNLEKMMSVE